MTILTHSIKVLLADGRGPVSELGLGLWLWHVAIVVVVVLCCFAQVAADKCPWLLLTTVHGYY